MKRMRTRLLRSCCCTALLALVAGCVTTRVEKVQPLLPNDDLIQHPLSQILKPFNACQKDTFSAAFRRDFTPQPSCTVVHAPDFALSLSGGGYRAALFHLGAIKRLNDLGLLKRVRMLCAVSGGAITGALLTDRWNQLAFNNDGVATNLDEVITKPILAMTERTIDVPVAATNLLSLGALGATIRRDLDDGLFHGRRLVDLPTNADSPLLVILATEMITNRTWFLSRDYIGDSAIQTARGQNMLLSQAVTASSAFPLVLGPINFEWGPNAIRQIPTDRPCPADASIAACDLAKALAESFNNEARKIVNGVEFIDGGVEDNLGINKCSESSELEFVSDAGVPLDAHPEQKYTNSIDALLRVIDIIHDRATHSDYSRVCYQSKPGTSVCWALRGEPPLNEQFGLSRDQTNSIRRASNLATRFKQIPRETQCAVMTQGYLVAASALQHQHYPQGRVEKSLLPCANMW